jgi:hypothetical protein
VAKYRAEFDSTQAAVLRGIAKTLGGYGGALAAIAKSMDARDGAMAALKRQLLASAEAAGPLADRLGQEGAAFERALGIYEKAERGWGSRTVAPTAASRASGWFISALNSSVNSTGFDWADDEIGVTIIRYGAKAEVSLIELGLSGEYSSVSAKVGAAEAYWNAGAGVYQYDESGKRFWSPTVAAEVGVSAAIVSITANGAYSIYGGDTDERWDDFGVQGSVTYDVGAAEAKVGISLALFDEDGNLSPELKAGASAEAIVVQADASAGITVAGIEATVTGKVGVGIGAHADVGFTDGKIKVDVGAYVGVGGSVGFEVDAAAAVDAVYTGAKALYDWATTLW